MGRPWLKNGKIVYEAGRPVYCNTCPCTPTTGCQCIMHYFAVWCKGDRTGTPRWLTVAEVQACHPTWDIVAVTANIFYIGNSEGDGCFDLGGVELPEGWDPWCWDGSMDCPPGPEDQCPSGTILCLAVYVGTWNCTPCNQTMGGCSRPTSWPDLPADPTTLTLCGA